MNPRPIVSGIFLLSIAITGAKAEPDKEAVGFFAQNSRTDILRHTNMAKPLPDRFNGIPLSELPKVAVLSTAERVYVTSLIASMIDVLENRKPLLENDPVFGQGKFFWPKDPRTPVRTSITYGTQNFAFRSISIGFRRTTSDGEWIKATMSIHPRNFPAGVFNIGLSQSDFDRFTLIDAFEEVQPERALKKFNTFLYRIDTGQNRVFAKMEARADVSNISKGFAEGFHELSMERLSD